MDQAADVALPPNVAPLNTMADGVADWQTISGPPALTVEGVATVMVADPVTVCVQEGGVV